ncbi:ABC transporter ATP-binding protein [Bacillus thuringiensis]|uniref:ABC transporter ATP-binding protein n=1 Tax=Bacillus thuringiensis TaxID=1428 RepID=UPI000BF88B46|nr:ABC transporter ATP-binding protein [Bacillus thuringiensis]PEY73230.1 hypothetical protein CN355_11350 [Bacillus thuringiensis]
MKTSKWARECWNRIQNDKILITLVIIFTIAGAAAGSATPLLVAKLIDEAIPLASTTSITGYALGIVVSLCLVELFTGLRRYTISNIVLRLTRKLRLDVLKRLFLVPADFFNATSKGEILQRCVDDTQAFQKFSLETLPTFLYQLFSAAFAIAAVCYIFWPLGILIIIIYLLYLIPVRHYGTRQRQTVSELNQHESYLKHLFLEKLRSIRLIKTFGAEEKEYQKYLEEQEKWADLTLQRYIIDNVFRNFPRVLDSLAPAIVYGIGGWKVFTGTMSIGELIAITRFLPAINAPIKSFSTTFLALKDIGVRLERVTEYLYLPIEPGMDDGLEKLNQINGTIEFLDVKLETERGKVLNGVTFKVRHGEKVALVGQSGSGKSTVLRMISRLVEPTSGEILIDGHSLRNLHSNSLRKRIGVVNQDTFLFNNTIMNNLMYLSPATRDTAKEMAAIVEVNPFIEGFINESDKKIGENGRSLSGGQRQRLAIARTLLKDFDILLLDEATSALDRNNEVIVHKAIEQVTAHKTCLYVAHRLETVVNADRIFVFDNGKVVEAGTHHELLALNGYYAALWEKKSLQKERG